VEGTKIGGGRKRNNHIKIKRGESGSEEQGHTASIKARPSKTIVITTPKRGKPGKHGQNRGKGSLKNTRRNAKLKKTIKRLGKKER